MQSASRTGAARGIQTRLLVLAVPQAAASVWALLAPRFFYDGFPAPSHPWVASFGPYSEHLIIDYGAASLALVAMSLLTVRRPERAIATIVAIGWMAWTLPHLLFHAAHADALAPIDSILNIAIAVVAAALSIGLLVAARVAPQGGTPSINGSSTNDQRAVTPGRVSSG